MSQGWKLRQQSTHRPAHLHLADEPILVHTLSFTALGFFRPHLFHILQHHVAMSIERFDSRQQLPVIPTRDQDLGM